MKSKKQTKKILFVILMTIFQTTTFTVMDTSEATPEPFFSIAILAPTTSPARPLWYIEMEKHFPKIGINISVNDHTGWAQISPRTWGHPGPYPIGTYDEGGFDILFIGWGWGLDIDFTGVYDSASIVPNGDNFYQYNRSYMDEAMYQYSNSFDLENRLFWANKIQQYLYEDLPSITLAYSVAVYPMDANFDQDSWDGVLWHEEYQDIANWEIPGQTEFHYACPADFENFHPYKAESVYDTQWISQIYRGLFERISDNPYNRSYAPYACTSYNSSDGKIYDIQINPNLVFADGHVCNASDVKYSYDLLINPDFGNPDYSYFSQYITNETVSINSEFDVTINFSQPYIFQGKNLAVEILPKHIWENTSPEDHESQAIAWAANDTLDSNLMGIGPYYLMDYDGINGIIHLKRNEYYDDWSGVTPYFEDVYFEFWYNKEGALAALAAGAIDMVDAQFSPQLSEIPAVVTYEIVETQGYQEIAVNCLHPIIGTGELCPIPGQESAKHIRKAISHIVPRVSFIEESYGGLGVPGITAFPKGAVGFNDSLESLEYSTSLALQHMELAGYDVTAFFVGSSTNLGFGLVTSMSILACIGGSFLIYRRIIKK